LTADGGLVLTASAQLVQAYLDSRKVIISCRHCGTARAFRGRAVHAAPPDA
jgi:hypothetical protein